MSFTKKSIVGRDGLSPLPADTLGTGFRMRRSRADHQPAIATGSRRKRGKDNEETGVTGPTTSRPYGESLARLGAALKPLPDWQILPSAKIGYAWIRWTGSDSKTSPHYRASVPQAFLPASSAYCNRGVLEWRLVLAP